MSSINLGSTNSTGALTGLVSGINADAIIKSAVAAKSVPLNDLVLQQSVNSGKIAALKSMKAILDNLKDISDALRNPAGVNNEDENAFLYRKSTVTGSPTGFDNATDMVTVTADPGAQEATYSFEIEQLAKKEIETLSGFGTTTADLTDGGTPEVVAGTFQINSVDIVISAGATLTDIQNAINAKSSETGATASIITITPESAADADDGVYQLQIASDSTGAANTITFTNFTTVFPVSGGITAAETQTAQDANIRLNGNLITRSTNTINDVVENVTFELLNFEDNTILTVDITKDTSVADTQIQNFIASVNQFLIFSSSQQARDAVTGEPLSSALLADSPLLKTLTSTIQTELKRTVGGAGSSFNTLSDLGFEFELFEGEEIEGDPTTPLTALLTDRGKLGGFLTNNYEEVRDVFELQFNATGANDILAASGSTNDLSINSFTMTVDITQPEGKRVLIDPGGGASTFYATFTPYDSGDLTGGGTITGADGTSIEGLTMVYTGDGTDSGISVTVTQGVGERIYNAMESYTDFLGIIDDQILLLQDRNEDIDQEIIELNADIADFQATLTSKFAILEAQIQQANSTLGFLNAFANAQNSNSY
jgi:flagellar hook-associated protein 2